MRVKLQDYVELRLFQEEVGEWRANTGGIFENGRGFNYEAVRKHIEQGVQLDVSERDLEMLKALVEMCAHWKSLARKVLKSRELCKLELAAESLLETEKQPNCFCVVLQRQE